MPSPFLEGTTYACYYYDVYCKVGQRAEDKHLLTTSPERWIDVSVSEEFSQLVSEEWLSEVALKSLQVALSKNDPGHVSIVISDDACIKELNSKYRGLNEVTDVLAFSSIYGGHWEGDLSDPTDNRDNLEDFILPPDQIPPLGEVIISYPQSVRQAAENNHSVHQEIAVLTAHGILHLIGHDHMDNKDAIVMQSKEHDIASLISVEE